MPHLKPAIRQRGKLHVGRPDDSHATIRERLSLKPGNDSEHGFSPTNSAHMFLTRKQAIDWLKRYEPDVYQKVTGKLPAEGLHSHIYSAAKGVVQQQLQADLPPAQQAPPPAKPPAIGLPSKTAIVYDRGGLYLYCAEKLAESYGKVMYYLADADAYPTSQKHTIGAGLPSVKRIHDFWKYLDQADIVYFFDCYDGELQHYLRGKGYKVFGSGRGEQVEIDKVGFLDALKQMDLPVAETYHAKGMDDLCEYLKKHDGQTLFLKNLHRGDFESRKFTSMAQSRPFLNDLKKRLGSASDTIEVLVQHKIDADIEVGYDGFCVDGKFTENCIVGYEIKDKGFIGKVFDSPPPLVGDINGAFGPTLKKLGYRGNYSTELRVTAKSEPYYIDATCRVPSPPGEIICELYENWAEATWQIANGQLPVLKPKAEFVAEIILTAGWHSEHELHVSIPAAIRPYVKLKNHTMRDGEFYCVPNGNGEFFGAVVAWADTVDEAIKLVLERAEQIEADELEYSDLLFDTAKEQIAAGVKHGVEF